MGTPIYLDQSLGTALTISVEASLLCWIPISSYFPQELEGNGTGGAGLAGPVKCEKKVHDIMKQWGAIGHPPIMSWPE